MINLARRHIARAENPSVPFSSHLSAAFLAPYATAPLVFDRPALLVPAVGAELVRCRPVTRRSHQDSWGLPLYPLNVASLVAARISPAAKA